MPLNQILLIIIGGGMVAGMLYVFIRVLLRPTPKPVEPHPDKKTETGVAGKA
ncbi:MAG: hypothetical protein ONB48_13200 [candidate division KSB1 bacterium]|nr:hypothetical protein [candidate division KSB1 bacterium]MDZ7274944.1 hypothetical protein [candidate division KSB1 bacterium]MDZ7286605.1 hypothetical protein [candidate division KSB1 bacterium]MDZ7299231.1 hypothetical protein [candidate division KSB1 bacterium]MDZ7309186.1 hypothetical protein [candidate division KSB1 bacterium]